jgi:hypothetical protein
MLADASQWPISSILTRTVFGRSLRFTVSSTSLADADGLKLVGQVGQSPGRLSVCAHDDDPERAGLVNAASPAWAAGEPGTARTTTTPSMPSRVATASFAATIPILGVGTRPLLMSSGTTRFTVSTGTANPMRALEPDGDVIAVVTPISRPAESSSGPPEFPGFTAASVWMTLPISRPAFVGSRRFKALMTPVVSD